jgi:hypothetical protein
MNNTSPTSISEYFKRSIVMNSPFVMLNRHQQVMMILMMSLNAKQLKNVQTAKQLAIEVKWVRMNNTLLLVVIMMMMTKTRNGQSDISRYFQH